MFEECADLCGVRHPRRVTERNFFASGGCEAPSDPEHALHPRPHLGPRVGPVPRPRDLQRRGLRAPRVVIGENRTFRGEEDLLADRGVALDVRQDPTCIRLMTDFIRAHPALWYEDLGV